MYVPCVLAACDFVDLYCLFPALERRILSDGDDTGKQQFSWENTFIPRKRNLELWNTLDDYGELTSLSHDVFGFHLRRWHHSPLNICWGTLPRNHHHVCVWPWPTCPKINDPKWIRCLRYSRLQISVHAWVPNSFFSRRHVPRMAMSPKVLSCKSWYYTSSMQCRLLYINGWPIWYVVASWEFCECISPSIARI